MFGFFRNLISNKTGALVCPHCENQMAEGHDVDRCARKRMSRRFFFQLAGGAAAAVAVAPYLPEVLTPEIPVSGIAIAHTYNNRFLPIEMITQEMLRTLQNNLVFTKLVSREYGVAFDRQMKIGDRIQVRRPRAFAQRMAS